jgi:predicted ATPase
MSLSPHQILADELLSKAYNEEYILWPAQMTPSNQKNGVAMLLNSLHLKNILSFKDAQLDLQPLNVLIGPNASGKSNLIETIALLQAIPDDLAGFFRRNGPVGDWIWNGDGAQISGARIAEVSAVLTNPYTQSMPLRYELGFTESGQRLQVVAERLGNNEAYDNTYRRPYLFFEVENGSGRIWPTRTPTSSARDDYQHKHDESSDAVLTRLTPEVIGPGKSVLSEIRDPVNFPVPSQTVRRFSSMKVYRSWNVGRDSPARRPQATDGAIDFLEEDFSNLALVVNELQGQGFESSIDSYLKRFYESYYRLHPRVYGGTIQLAANEVGISSAVPATRLSDGTIRFIALLAIMCHPNPPELICIEEPEIALHPDAMPLLAELLKLAAERTQLIVTTHSPELVNQFSDEPETVVVCERTSAVGTQFQRLSTDSLQDWLNDYQLGEVWMSGAAGGTRW